MINPINSSGLFSLKVLSQILFFLVKLQHNLTENASCRRVFKRVKERSISLGFLVGEKTIATFQWNNLYAVMSYHDAFWYVINFANKRS